MQGGVPSHHCRLLCFNALSCTTSPPEEIQTSEVLRTEAGQLIGQELIKALVNFKQMDSQSFNLNRKTKNKSGMLVFKVVCNMLTKK
jgi:hypothetical protein